MENILLQQGTDSANCACCPFQWFCILPDCRIFLHTGHGTLLLPPPDAVGVRIFRRAGGVMDLKLGDMCEIGFGDIVLSGVICNLPPSPEPPRYFFNIYEADEPLIIPNQGYYHN